MFISGMELKIRNSSKYSWDDIKSKTNLNGILLLWIIIAVHQMLFFFWYLNKDKISDQIKGAKLIAILKPRKIGNHPLKLAANWPIEHSIPGSWETSLQN